ncbi:hypothetical protein IO397_001592 [Campylobacter lari]|nr:hypothetical protein [Campylobacter lari]EGK8030842.1 hypothetical protein [Campylobacter lari]
MNLIFTMAGKYRRFFDNGYKIPKYLLPWKSNTIFYEILSEFTKRYSFKNIFFIVNKNDSAYLNIIGSTIEEFNISKHNIYAIEDTKSQAETAFLGIKYFEHLINSDPVIFHNIDTILYDRNFFDIERALEIHDGYIDIFSSDSEEYSYIEYTANIVNRIEEKKVISNSASSGLYGFKNIDLYLKYYSEEANYISDLYKKMIANDNKIMCGKLYSIAETIVLGTPEEYLRAICKLR